MVCGHPPGELKSPSGVVGRGAGLSRVSIPAKRAVRWCGGPAELETHALQRQECHRFEGVVSLGF